MSADRQRIGQQILNACAGSETAILAQVDALATSIGAMHFLCGRSLSEADAVAEEACDMLRHHIRNNWGRVEVAQ